VLIINYNLITSAREKKFFSAVSELCGKIQKFTQSSHGKPMRTILLFLIIISLNCSSWAKENKKAKICLNMIVKNESQVIRRSLESAKPLIDYWVIVDTGSTDGTQEIIKEFMKEIPGELHERPWVNFAHNRNEALSLAKDKADYLLFIDADDKFEISPNFSMPALDQDAYYITIKYSNLNYDRIQLIKSSVDWKWGGVLHEALASAQAKSWGHLDGISMIIIGGGDRSCDPKKFEKDAQILEAALKEEPDNARYQFYLAQSYRDAGMPELALKNYEKRVALGGWDQEVFWSLYQIALLQETLSKPEENICKSYAKAFHYRPTRAEPLYRLCNYYRRKENYLMGYLVAQFALKIKPSKDPLFVEAWIYDYAILLEYSICAYWIGRYEESHKACNQLISNQELPPNVRSCVERNLSFVLPKLATPANDDALKKAG